MKSSERRLDVVPCGFSNWIGNDFPRVALSSGNFKGDHISSGFAPNSVDGSKLARHRFVCWSPPRLDGIKWIESQTRRFCLTQNPEKDNDRLEGQFITLVKPKLRSCGRGNRDRRKTAPFLQIDCGCWCELSSRQVYRKTPHTKLAVNKVIKSRSLQFTMRIEVSNLHMQFASPSPSSAIERHRWNVCWSIAGSRID